MLAVNLSSVRVYGLSGIPRMELMVSMRDCRIFLVIRFIFLVFLVFGFCSGLEVTWKACREHQRSDWMPKLVGALFQACRMSLVFSRASQSSG